MANQWGADVPISMPQPLRRDQVSLVPMGGFTMTVDGLFPDLSSADAERLSTPAYAPYDPRTVEVSEPDPEEEAERG
ncbi:hypothetical protein ACPCSE_29715 [Streptomyces cellulosae]